jgi:Na+/H+ antiporter NhaB
MKRPITDQEKQELKEQHWSWLRMIMVQTGCGMAIGGLVGLLIIYHDFHRIGTMIGKSQYWFGYSFLLMFGFATICGMVAGGAAIWIRAERERE